METKRRDRIIILCAALVLLLSIGLWWRESRRSPAALPSSAEKSGLALHTGPQLARQHVESTGPLLAYEPFDYPADTLLVDQAGGTGFNGAWQPGGFNARVFDLFVMKPGALVYPGLATRGSNRLTGTMPPEPEIAGIGRVLPSNLAVPGGRYYLSFLHQPDGEEEYASVVLGTGRGAELSIGKSASVNQFHISQRGGVKRVYSGIAPVVGQTVFIVVKMEFLEGPDRFILYMNPVPGRPEPTTGVVKSDLDLEYADQIFLYSRSDWSVDEIRLGTTWEAVTPAAAVEGPESP